MRYLLLLMTLSCSSYPELVIPPDEETCEKICEEELDKCWPKPLYHEEEANHCFIKNEQCLRECHE